jgi:Sporulation and spore germination
MHKFMVKPQIGKVGMLLAGIFLALPFGLVGCLDNNSNSPTSSVTPSLTPSSSPPETIAPIDSPASTPVPSAQVSSGRAQVYWISGSGTKLALTPANITLPTENSPDEQLSAALKRLIKGPANSDVTSSIPPETKLNSLTVQKDGVHVDLNKAFTSGGGSTNMQGRLGQIIYTASSLNPADPVWISVEGEPLKVLGGEGLELSQPMTRTEFSKNFSL